MGLSVGINAYCEGCRSPGPAASTNPFNLGLSLSRPVKLFCIVVMLSKFVYGYNTVNQIVFYFVMFER